MHIKLINKKLYFNKYKVKCAIGKRGISDKKREGDNITPRGTFRFNEIFYRKDRVSKIRSYLKKTTIKNNMGWCDDVQSIHYNKLIFFPFNLSAERLKIKKNIYDIIVILDFNLKPIIKNKGSAIFLHVATKEYKPTKGCIAVSKTNLKKLISLISSKSKITIF
ncbi:L,D-transpeptidase family protein [Pelagibacteraceae bacterium]|nr:L,D-transpeptidase family protein [Pelagibacteraceae bacterium]